MVAIEFYIYQNPRFVNASNHRTEKVISYAMRLLVLDMRIPLSSLDASSLNTVGIDAVLTRAVLHEADQVAEKHDNRHLANGGNVD